MSSACGKFVTCDNFMFKCSNSLGCWRSRSNLNVTNLLVAFKFSSMGSLEKLHFDNLALQTLPLDEEQENYVRQVRGACFSKVLPTPVTNPRLVAFSQPALDLLDILPAECEREDFAAYFSGNKLLPGASPAAHCYCGHQFGSFAGQLGDGATMYLGEVVNGAGGRWEIQFKGAGKTPYSRSADGRKVLRSSIREFLCSEAMHHLGIPTTRAATCVTSNSTVVRDIFYSGDPILEKCTVILRVAQTFIRFGSFEICKKMDGMTGRQGPSVGREDILKTLLDYVIRTFYSDIWTEAESEREAVYVSFFARLVALTARMVAEWQCVGWCHGVLNTDNMSIVGLTIDYGPFGFMDVYDPDYVCNSSDDGGRYSYARQPEMCHWNLGVLSESLAPVVPANKTRPLLDAFWTEYNQHYLAKMRHKLGLVTCEDADEDLVTSLLDTMRETGTDFTNTWRGLSRMLLPGSPHYQESRESLLAHLLTQCCTLDELKKVSEASVDAQQLQMFLMLMRLQPALAEQMGARVAGIQREMAKAERRVALDEMTHDDKTAKDAEAWGMWLDQYEARLSRERKGVADWQLANQERRDLMHANNPSVVLRNYLAQTAITAAEGGDFGAVRRLLARLETPYSDGLPGDGAPSTAGSASADEGAAASLPDYTRKPPTWSLDLQVT